MNYKLFENFLPKEAIEIRYKVFTLEQGFANEDDLDVLDDKSIHIIVFINELPIGTARMFKEGEGIYHIGRLAILKEHRGKGIGSFILGVFENKARELGAKKMHLGSQIDKAAFYEKNGYKKYGDIFDDAGYPHIMMEKIL